METTPATAKAGRISPIKWTEIKLANDYHARYPGRAHIESRLKALPFTYAVMDAPGLRPAGGPPIFINNESTLVFIIHDWKANILALASKLLPTVYAHEVNFEEVGNNLIVRLWWD